MKLRLSIRVAGDFADAVLKKAGRLETTAVFRRSFYAEDEDHNLICFVNRDIEPGPLNAICGNWPDELPAILDTGVLVAATAPGIFSAARLELDGRERTIWKPAPWPPLEASAMKMGVNRLTAFAPSLMPENSLATLLLKGSNRHQQQNPMLTALLAKAAQCAVPLQNWLASPSWPAPEGIFSFLGLGLGLTPSGDDVLAGSLLALHAMGMNRMAERFSGEVSARAGSRTNRISGAHIAAAGRGAGAAALHDFLSDILKGGDHLEELAPRVSRVGHTSGWDAVFGMALTLQAALGNARRFRGTQEESTP